MLITKTVEGEQPLPDFSDDSFKHRSVSSREIKASQEDRPTWQRCSYLHDVKVEKDFGFSAGRASIFG